MSSNISSQTYEAFLPVYDTVPEKWEDARAFLVEQLKKISNAVNIRTIGWLLYEELLSGQAFVPGVIPPGDNPAQTRSVLRMVVDVSPIIIGVNKYAHGITFDSNFTLIDLWIAATNSTSFLAQVITGDSVIMNVTDLVITSTAAYDLGYAVVEYCQEE
jgi:hypothetical protein